MCRFVRTAACAQAAAIPASRKRTGDVSAFLRCVASEVWVYEGAGEPRERFLHCAVYRGIDFGEQLHAGRRVQRCADVGRERKEQRHVEDQPAEDRGFDQSYDSAADGVADAEQR